MAEGTGLLKPYSYSFLIYAYSRYCSFFFTLGMILKTGRYCSLVSGGTIFVVNNLHVQIGRSSPDPQKYAGD